MGSGISGLYDIPQTSTSSNFSFAYTTLNRSSIPKPTSATTKSQKNARQTLLDEATTSEAKRIIEQLYRKGATVGDGGTADAIRNEKKTGNPTGGKSHQQKGRERVKQIDNLLKKNPNHPDKDLLLRLKSDLLDALGE